MPDNTALKNVRQEIDYCWEEFQGILQENSFNSIYGDLYKGEGMSLSTNPKGYEKDNPAIDYLKLKSFIAETPVSDKELTQATLNKKTVTAFEALMPLLQFINRTLQQDL
jgi:uncharacterized protein (DUF2461 family)